MADEEQLLCISAKHDSMGYPMNFRANQYQSTQCIKKNKPFMVSDIANTSKIYKYHKAYIIDHILKH